MLLLSLFQEFQGTTSKIVDLGGHCDCEVLLNVDPDTWESRRNEEITGPDILGLDEWQQFLSDLLSRSGMETREV